MAKNFRGGKQRGGPGGSVSGSLTKKQKTGAMPPKPAVKMRTSPQAGGPDAKTLPRAVNNGRRGGYRNVNRSADEYATTVVSYAQTGPRRGFGSADVRPG